MKNALRRHRTVLAASKALSSKGLSSSRHVQVRSTCMADIVYEFTHVLAPVRYGQFGLTPTKMNGTMKKNNTERVKEQGL